MHHEKNDVNYPMTLANLLHQKKKKKRSKSLIRTMSQDALLLNSDGSDRFVWSTYNDYERAIIWTICCCLAQCFAYVDPNGFYKILSLPVRMLSHGLIRVFVDFTLFQMAAGYRKALQPVGTPRDSGLLIGLFLSVSFLAIFLSLEYAQVPTAGLPGCANTLWNFFRHFSVSLVEFCVIFLTLRFALRVRTKLKRSKARGTRHGRVRLQAAVDQIITRTFLLCAITFCVLGWSAFVGARNAGSAYDCYQPACTFPDYFSTVFWAVLYVVITWFGVIFFGVGLPPPFSCLGSKPTISALCCCCPRPSWLAPASTRLSFTSSIDSMDDSEHSSQSEMQRWSMASTLTGRPFFLTLKRLFFGHKTDDTDDGSLENEDFSDDAKFEKPPPLVFEKKAHIDRVSFDLTPPIKRDQFEDDDYEAALDKIDDHAAPPSNPSLSSNEKSQEDIILRNSSHSNEDTIT
mmetsp:Transcript_1933/g.2574  ORF Transcript_1933/g.2574 Transcript_1933/m.2574 type:complete len:459 (+) Transcript_1933:447-1823(+)